MSTELVKFIDEKDSNYTLTLESGCSGVKFFIQGPDEKGLKFWIKEEDLTTLHFALDHYFESRFLFKRLVK